MSDRIFRMTVAAEIFGVIIMGLIVVIDLLEPKSRISAPIGALIILLTIVAMIVVGIVGLRRPRRSKE